MNAQRILLTVTIVLALLLAGCTTAKSTVRQKDGTYRTTHHLIFKPSMSDFLDFRCLENYDTATTLHGVTYEWPQGSGSLMMPDTIVFTGRNLNCRVVGNSLTINGREFGQFKEGDRVRITPDGKVLVNDVEHVPPTSSH